jgi:hypothetical protein
MQKTLIALGFAAATFVLLGQAATAMPLDTAAVKDAVTANSALQPAQYYERHARHGVVKCFRDFVIGPYRCHYYRSPF